MATQTYTYTDDDNQIWCKCSSGGSASDSWAVTVAGLPSGAKINSVTLRFTVGYIYNTPDYAAISMGGASIWSDYSPNSGARSIDLTGKITGNGAVTLTFQAKAESSENSNVYFAGISLAIDYSIPCSSFAIDKTSVDAGSAVTLTITRADASYTHRVTFTLGSQTETIANVATSLSYTIPLSWVDQLPNALSGVCTVKVETMSGGVILGAVSTQLTVTVPSSIVPSAGTISMSLVDGYNGLYIQGYSRVKVSVSGHKAGTGASVASVYVVVGSDGVWADTASPVVTSSLLRTAGTVSITVTVKDSRGRTAVGTASVTVTAYAPVTITGKTCLRCNASGTAAPASGTAAKVGVSYSYTALAGNTVTVSMYYRKAGAASWTAFSGFSSTSGGTAVVLSGILSLDARWEFRFVVADKISQAEQTAQIAPGAVFMVWSKVRKAFGFGVYPEGEKQIAIADDWKLMSKGRDLSANTHHSNEILGNTCSLWDNTGLTIRYYNTEAKMTNQPSPYGLLLSCTYGSEKAQLWFSQAYGALFHRQGNYSGWSASQAGDDANEWVKICDESTIGSMLTTARMINAYPVGAIYISSNSTSPASLFGGTWTQITDRFLLAAGSSYAAGGTGGEASHTLTTAEMPSHTHAISNAKHSSVDADTSYGNYPVELAGDKASNWGGPTTTAAGGGGSHNNMPPWYGVYMWRRTA